jgi:hypothetical protein
MKLIVLLVISTNILMAGWWYPNAKRPVANFKVSSYKSTIVVNARYSKDLNPNGYIKKYIALLYKNGRFYNYKYSRKPFIRFNNVSSGRYKVKLIVMNNNYRYSRWSTKSYTMAKKPIAKLNISMEKNKYIFDASNSKSLDAPITKYSMYMYKKVNSSRYSYYRYYKRQSGSSSKMVVDDLPAGQYKLRLFVKNRYNKYGFLTKKFTIEKHQELLPLTQKERLSERPYDSSKKMVNAKASIDDHQRENLKNKLIERLSYKNTSLKRVLNSNNNNNDVQITELEITTPVLSTKDTVSIKNGIITIDYSNYNNIKKYYTKVWKDGEYLKHSYASNFAVDMNELGDGVYYFEAQVIDNYGIKSQYKYFYTEHNSKLVEVEDVKFSVYKDSVIVTDNIKYSYSVLKIDPDDSIKEYQIIIRDIYGDMKFYGDNTTIKNNEIPLLGYIINREYYIEVIAKRHDDTTYVDYATYKATLDANLGKPDVNITKNKNNTYNIDVSNSSVLDSRTLDIIENNIRIYKDGVLYKKLDHYSDIKYLDMDEYADVANENGYRILARLASSSDITTNHLAYTEPAIGNGGKWFDIDFEDGEYTIVAQNIDIIYNKSDVYLGKFNINTTSITEDNKAPIVDIKLYKEDGKYVIDASNSYDPDGFINEYEGYLIDTNSLEYYELNDAKNILDLDSFPKHFHILFKTVDNEGKESDI